LSIPRSIPKFALFVMVICVLSVIFSIEANFISLFLLPDRFQHTFKLLVVLLGGTCLGLFLGRQITRAQIFQADAHAITTLGANPDSLVSAGQKLGMLKTESLKQKSLIHFNFIHSVIRPSEAERIAAIRENLRRKQQGLDFKIGNPFSGLFEGRSRYLTGSFLGIFVLVPTASLLTIYSRYLFGLEAGRSDFKKTAQILPTAGAQATPPPASRDVASEGDESQD